MSPSHRPRGFRTGPLLAALALLLGGAPAAGQTILNVERLQPGDVTGFHWGVEGSFTAAQGNSEYTEIQSGVVVGRRWTGDWLRLFAGLDYRSETGETFERERYLHLRLNHWLAERWQTFHFVQLQTSRHNLLRERFLVGSGVRRRLLDGATTLDVGTGAMFEAEELDPARVPGPHPVQSDVWRMANLVVATRQLSESVRLLGVAYVQPELAAFGDVRTLTDLSLRISLTENLDLTVQGDWRYDSRPPEGRERDDFVFRTGFQVTFR